MKKRHLFLSMSLALPLTAAELSPTQVPEAAKWVLHADLDAMRGSDSGSTVLAQIREDHGAKLTAAERMFALHPLDDLNSVTLYGDGRKDHAVALIAGNFDREHLTDIVKAAEDYKTGTHADVTVHSWKDHGKTQHAAFFTDDLLVFSRQQDLIHLALDTLQSGGSWKVDGFLRKPGAPLLVSAEAHLQEIEMSGDEARILGMMKVLRLAITEDQGRFTVRLGSEAKDEGSAKILSRILDGVIALGQALDPKLAGLDLDSDVRTTDDAGVTASLSLPTEDWATLVNRSAAEKTKDEP